MREISQIICLVILTILSVIDIRYRKVPQHLLVVGNLGAIWYQCMVGGLDRWLLICGGCIGVIFLIISRVTKEEIGYGDSWGILMLGIFLGVWGVLEVLLLSFLLLIIAAILYFISGRLRRKSTLPFYPFLTAGYLLTVLVGVF